jgi:hypothetical protein
MYLTAMLVRKSAPPVEGVNALLFEEPANFERLSTSPSTRTILGIVETYVAGARTLRASKRQIPGAGNAVDAYIDIVISGEISLDALREIGARTRVELGKPTAADTIAWTDGVVLVRAYIRQDMEPLGTLDRLLLASEALLANPRLDEPLLIIKKVRHEDASTYELDEASTDRLRLLHGDGWVPPRITLSDEVADDFHVTLGEDIHDHLVGVMTGGIEPSHLARLGGVEIVDEHGVPIPTRRR